MHEREPFTPALTEEDVEEFLLAAGIAGRSENREIFRDGILDDEIYEVYLAQYFWYLMRYPKETAKILAKVAELN